jgi:hypothetical protein
VTKQAGEQQDKQGADLPLQGGLLAHMAGKQHEDSAQTIVGSLGGIIGGIVSGLVLSALKVDAKTQVIGGFAIAFIVC